MKTKINNCILALFIVLLTSLNLSADIKPVELLTIKPFNIRKDKSSENYVAASLDNAVYASVNKENVQLEIDIPLPKKDAITVNLERFDILGPNAKFFSGNSTGIKPTAVLYRGNVNDDANSSVFLAFTENNRCNGMITLSSGQRFIISEGPVGSEMYSDGLITITEESDFAIMPDFPDFCGIEENPFTVKIVESLNEVTAEPVYNTLVCKIGVDGDHDYVKMFPSEVDAVNYAYQLYGAVSDIYLRDLNVKLQIEFIRMWPDDTEPFDANDLYSFATYWDYNEDPFAYDMVQLLSGRRNLDYGGIAYVGGTCSGGYTSATYSIIGYLNGSFPSSLELPDIGNWDVIVCAHEMGHNFGTRHTHDLSGYDPLIDSCAQGYPTVGTIMSYCHAHPGYTSNTELRFHGRVIEFLKANMTNSCFFTDCNDNGIPDGTDILNATSADVNSNGVPDECEDCNGNSILDPIDIANMTSTDYDGNNIPDECQENCNGNPFPDIIEINFGVNDVNYNYVLDACETDCNGNGIIDYQDIVIDFTSTDYDRNMIPDECQDCNNNDTTDWIDLYSEHNLYVAQLNSNYIREYHRRSGVPIQNFGSGSLNIPYDVVFGPDHMMYIANYGGNNIIKVDPIQNIVTEFVSSSTGLTAPSALLFNNAGNLLVASLTSADIYEYDGSSGTLIGTFISGSSNGLSSPYNMTYDNLGNILITSSDNSIYKYDGATGLFISVLVSSGSGGLNDPRGLCVTSDNRLLVTSHNTDQILEYNAVTGSYIGVFSDEYTLNQPWGIQVGPNNNIFAAHNGSEPRIYEYNPVGRYYRSFVRGDGQMTGNADFAFSPLSDLDCNGNYVLDECDFANGTVSDTNNNSIPDVCEIQDTDGDLIADDIDNCPNDYNPLQEDNDLNGIGNVCCCIGIVGNIDLSADENPDISDLLLLVDYMFTVEVPLLPCPNEGDLNTDESVDISDLLMLVDYMFTPNSGIVLNNCL